MRTGPRPPLRRRLRTRHWLVIDGLLGGAYGIFSFGILGAREPNQALAVTATALAVATLPAARRWPIAATAGSLSVFWLGLVSQRYPWIALFPLAYALLRAAERHRLPVAAALLAAGLTGPVATVLPAPHSAGGVAPFGLVLCVAWTVGVAVRQHRLYTEALIRHEAQRAAERAAEERARIARELHDVVAHGMSVIAVQAAYGRLVATSEPAKGAEALAVIESTGRESLADLRRMLGVLRGGPDPEPAPDLSDLSALAERTAAAGVAVEVSVVGSPGPLGPGLELAAYRIVQEALTNVVKHAGTDRARVTVEHRADALVLDITDEGRGVDGFQAGHGLAGVRERAALYGGTVLAGPRPGGGFRVVATLPVPAEPSR